jgi:hypothetical protein
MSRIARAIVIPVAALGIAGAAAAPVAVSLTSAPATVQAGNGVYLHT